MTINVTHYCDDSECPYFDKPTDRGCLCHKSELVMLTEAANEMLAALQLCIPVNVCLTNPNIRDDMNVPLDVPMGDLRKIAAAISQATGK